MSNRNVAIAQAILAQLGGRAFTLMTGASHLTAVESGLMFALPSHGRKPNKVVITLTAADDYTVEFFYIRAGRQTMLDTQTQVYCDTLRETFERATGLVTTMPRIVRVVREDQ